MIPPVLSIPAFIAGIYLLYKGSVMLVDGTTRTAARLGVSSLIVAMLIVALGSSVPELAVSLGALFQDHVAITLGSIIGACFANSLLVLGLIALYHPIKIKKEVVHKEMPFLIGSTALLLFATIIGLLDEYHFIGGILFVSIFVVFIYYLVRRAEVEYYRKHSHNLRSVPRNILFVLLGILGVAVGAWLTIGSAINFAEILGISEFIVAISVIAVGSSFPDLAISLVASRRGQSDIIVGAVIGANIFIVLMVTGVCALFTPLNAVGYVGHLLLLVIVSVVLLAVMYTRYTISQREGCFLLAMYCFYLGYLFLV